MPYAGKVESISIGMASSEVNSLIYIAKEQQYFVANGINVTIRNYASGLAAANGMLNGEVDIATAAEFVFVSKVWANENIRTVAVVDKFFNEYLVARTDRGISSVSDLSGKTIGVALGTAAQFYLGRFLELKGVNPNEVTLVDVPPPQTPNSLVNGTVDAVITWQPYVNAIENSLGNKIVMWPAQNNQLTYMTVICKDSWVVNHPILVSRFLNSLAQAESFLINNPNKAKEVIKNQLNYTDEYVALVWPDHEFSLSLGQSLVLAMRDEARWMMNTNLTSATEVPNFLNYIYVDGLISIKRESVSIIR